MMVSPEELLTLWRAPTSNDEPHDAKVWRRYGIDKMMLAIRSVTASDAVDSRTFQYTVDSWLSPPSLNWGYNAKTTYTVLPDGSLKIHVNAVPQGLQPKTIPRFGLEIPLSSSLTKAQWFGLGPHESYCDKKEGARIGLWQRSIDDMCTPYEVPQETGNRHATRWARLLDPRDGSGIEVRFERLGDEHAGPASRLFDFAFSKYTALDLETAAHPSDLPNARPLFGHYLRVDVAHQGLGTGSCGPRVLEKYELKTQPFEFCVYLKPYQERLGPNGVVEWEFDTPHVGESPFIRQLAH